MRASRGARSTTTPTPGQGRRACVVAMHPAGHGKRILGLSTAEIFSAKRLISPYSVNLSPPIMGLQHFTALLATSTSSISNNGQIMHNTPPLVVRQDSGKPAPFESSWTNSGSRPCTFAMSWTCSPDNHADGNRVDSLQGPDLALIAVAAAGLTATLCLNRRLRRFTLRQLGWRQQRIQRSWRPPGVW